MGNVIMRMPLPWPELISLTKFQFDSCDISRQFALVAPFRALSCPALLYAILSASARHISQRRGAESSQNIPSAIGELQISPEVALEYQDICISHLITLAEDTTNAQDEDLLAAAVVLRFYEEIDGESLEILELIIDRLGEY